MVARQLSSSVTMTYRVGPALSPPVTDPSPRERDDQRHLPVIEDALAYVHQVKVAFEDHPQIYHRFLELLSGCTAGQIKLASVTEQASRLFDGHPELIEGFKVYLPTAYKIEIPEKKQAGVSNLTSP